LQANRTLPPVECGDVVLLSSALDPSRLVPALPADRDVL
jgi:hypothetical protein